MLVYQRVIPINGHFNRENDEHPIGFGVFSDNPCGNAVSGTHLYLPGCLKMTQPYGLRYLRISCGLSSLFFDGFFLGGTGVLYIGKAIFRHILAEYDCHKYGETMI